MERTVKSVESEMRRLESALGECQTLDEAAGEARPMLTVRQWVQARMKGAISQSLPQ